MGGTIMKTHHLIKAGAMLLALSSASTSYAQEVTLKIAHFLPATSNIHQKFFVPWCDKLTKESNNRLKCQIYPAMQLGGNPPQLFDQAKNGLADISWTIAGYSAGRFPIIEVFELPFMMTSAEKTSPAVWDFVQQHDQAEFKDVKLLAVHTQEGAHFHMTKKPITQLADLRGLKIRAPTRLTSRSLSLLGATPVGMPIPQVPEALSKGVLDGGLMPWEIVPTIKAHELVKFHSVTDPNSRNLSTSVFILVMNKGKYDNLPADLKQVLDRNSGRETSIEIGRLFDSTKEPAIKLAQERKNEFNTIPAEELQKWEEVTRPIFDEWIKEFSTKGANGQELLKAARDLIAAQGK
jgi:TRAP-type transport system periplasmic protein